MKWENNAANDFLQLSDGTGNILGWIDGFGGLNGSLVTSLLPNVTVPFLGAPTGPCLSAQTAVNTLNGNFYSCQNGAWTLIGPTAGSLVSPVTSPNPLAFDVNVAFKGPNPYYDVTRYGVRAVSTVPSASATINSGSSSVTLSAASTFQNGDGVVLYGAGAPHSLSTPGAPTVTPSVARVLTATGIVVNGPTGATTYNYKVIARDKNGGLTAASTVGTTTTGAASLGSQSAGISAMTRSNATVTVTTSSAHGLTIGSMVYIQMSAGDTSFAGWYQVLTTADNTHFTFTSGLDTRNGANTTWTPGTATVYWFNCNRVAWSAVTGAFQYYIYSDRASAGTFALIGVSKPVNGAFVEGSLYWDDFGSPMMDGLTSQPGNIPATAPASATSDNLVTTILSGAGTTTLTLATTAGTSVSGVSILFDNAPNILTAATAANAATLYFPVPASGASYWTNSVLDLSALFVNILGAGLALKDTLILGAANWYGTNLPRSGTGTSFQFESLPSISIQAIPGILIANGGSGHYEGFQLTGSGTNNILMMQDGGGGAGAPIYERITFVIGNGDAVGIGWLGRGMSDGEANVTCRMRRIGAFGNQNTLGSTATPILFFNFGGGTIESIFMSGKGICARPASQPSFELTINWGYCQGGTLPFLTVAGGPSAGNLGGNIDIGHITPDTGAQPILTYLLGPGSFTGAVRINLIDESPSSGVPIVTGSALFTVKAYGAFSGQNTGVTSDSNFTDKFVSIFGPSGTIGYALPAPSTAAGAVVSAGGAAPIGTLTYTFAWIDALGRSTLVGASSVSVTTTTGNQTVTVTPPTPPVGAIGWAPYRNGALAGIPGCTFITGFAAFVDSGSACGASVPVTSNAITSGIVSQGIVAPQIQMQNTLFANLGTPSNGVFVYCSDCTVANPCAGSGTGAFAKRLNGVWVCN